MDRKLLPIISVVLTVLLFVSGVTAVLCLAAAPEAAGANGPIIYVDDDTCPGPGEGTQDVPYCRIQTAVDSADTGEEIRVAAGTYSDIHARDGITQVVIISKTIIIRGGYSRADWDTSDPAANPTIIDAQQQGRGISIVGTGSQWVTVDGFTITGGKVVSSSTSGSGGGVYAYQMVVSIANCNVYGNVAGQSGGGVYVRDCNNAMLTGNDVVSNTAANGGGIGISLSADATLTSNQVLSNTAISSTGGGIYLDQSDGATLTGNLIFNNRASSSRGGGVHLSNSDDLTLTDNDIQSNEADRGGGAYLLNSDSATLTGNDVSGNTTHSYGGGLYLAGSHDAGLSGNTVHGNTANSLYGGGIHLMGSDRAAVTRNHIWGNTADSRGGGLYLDGSDDVTLTNNVVVENRVTSGTSYGAGGCLNDSTARFLHTTMARNSGRQGQGQGVYVTTGARLWMTNTILVDHTVGIKVASGATATLACTLWGTGDWANGEDWEVSGTLVTDTLACNLWEEPGFVDADGGDYHIGSGSGAIDGGVDAGVTVDIDGDSRIEYAPPDIGADEFTVYHICLPLVRRGQ